MYIQSLEQAFFSAVQVYWVHMYSELQAFYVASWLNIYLELFNMHINYPID